LETQKAELLNRLDAQGWRVASVEDELEWWADEMWRVESVRSPAGVEAYVTFLVDPQTSNPRRRKKGEGVWAVMVSPGRPRDWLGVERSYTLGLGSGWARALPDLFEHLSALRAE